MKIFYAKKLCTDSKTLAEIVGGEDNLLVKGEGGGEGVGEGERKVELSVMVLGGGGLGAGAKQEAVGKDRGETAAKEGTGAGADATGVMQTDGFWDDLKGFVAQRLKDEGEAARTVETFRQAWVDGQK